MNRNIVVLESEPCSSAMLSPRPANVVAAGSRCTHPLRSVSLCSRLCGRSGTDPVLAAHAAELKWASRNRQLRWVGYLSSTGETHSS